MARGPDGTYTVARTPKFPGYVPRWYYWIPGIKPDISYVELLENELSRGVLDSLIDHLRHTGWELLAESGVHWYSRIFRRPTFLYVPDPDPSTPYTLFDEVEWQQKTREAVNQYERHRNAASCRKLAECTMQFGLALERVRQFDEACAVYRQAAQAFKAISSSEEAAKARRQADRVLKIHQALKKSPSPPEEPSNSVDFLRQDIARLRKEDDEYWGDFVTLDTPGYAAFVRKLGDAYLALAQALTNSSDPEQLQEGHNACVKAGHFYELLGLADEQAKAKCQKGYSAERYEVVTHRNSQGPAIFFRSAVWMATPAMKPYYENELAEFERRCQARQGK